MKAIRVHEFGAPEVMRLEEVPDPKVSAGLLPSLYSELREKALKKIVSEIQAVKYINQVIITLGKAGQKEFEHTKEFFSVLP